MTDRTPRAHLTTQSKARKRAVDILFESDLRESDPITTLSERMGDDTPPIRTFTADLVKGVVEHQREIDQRISECLTIDWSLERMPRVDRAIARMAVYEIDHTDIPVGVAISEATQLATELSTDESPAFINGLLGKAGRTAATRQ